MKFWLEFLFEIFYELLITNLKNLTNISKIQNNEILIQNIISKENLKFLNKIFCFLIFFKEKTNFEKSFFIFYPFDIFENCDKWFDFQKLYFLQKDFKKKNSVFKFDFIFQKCKFCKDFTKLRILKFEYYFFLNFKNLLKEKKEFKKLKSSVSINDFLDNNYFVKEAFLDYMLFKIK